MVIYGYLHIPQPGRRASSSRAANDGRASWQVRLYQGRVYDSLDTKKQRGIGCFSTPEQAGAAVDAAEAALKQGISPWAGPTRVNKHKRGETPVPAAKKPLVPSVVVQQRECKTLNLKSVPLPATREEVYNACVAAFPSWRSARARICAVRGSR